VDQTLEQAWASRRGADTSDCLAQAWRPIGRSCWALTIADLTTCQRLVACWSLHLPSRRSLRIGWEPPIEPRPKPPRSTGSAAPSPYRRLWPLCDLHWLLQIASATRVQCRRIGLLRPSP